MPKEAHASDQGEQHCLPSRHCINENLASSARRDSQTRTEAPNRNPPRPEPRRRCHPLSTRCKCLARAQWRARVV